VHPHDYKGYAADKAITNAFIPSLFKIPLLQHIGSPAECLVEKGDEVHEEMLLGKSTGFISANIHCPVPGVVKGIDDIILPSGAKSKCVTLEIQGEFNRLGKKRDSSQWKESSKQELLDLIKERGIVGLGGATFPTHVKYTIPRQKKVEAFVVNGVECEPYLNSDYRLMLEKTREILEGMRIVARILEPERIYFGIESNKPAAIELISAACSEENLDVEVVPLELKYPQGDEKQLLKAILDREVPSGGLPIDIGAVVSNVGTVFAIYEAVVQAKPLIERIVTVSGGAVNNPMNFKVRIGTPVRTLIEECGGFVKEPAKVIMGGPMMGFALHDLDMPVIKGTSGILALTKREVKPAQTTTCIQCGRCIAACPLGLNPTRLYKAVDHAMYYEAEEIGIMDCKECGCCGYVCPAHIPLIQGMKLGKRMLKKEL
jgi:electron transport complex protein RnfC